MDHNYFSVPDDFMSQVLTEDVLRKAGIKAKLNEEAPVETKEEKPEPVTESKEEAKEEHTCPLCESKLEVAIPDEKLLEHVGAMAEMFDEVYQEILAEQTKEDGKEQKAE